VVGEALVHVVEEVLRLDEEAAIAALQGRSRIALARPVLSMPVLPMKTKFAARGMKSSSASCSICGLLMVGCCVQGDVSTDQRSGRFARPIRYSRKRIC
jgi:hypothetical protein